MPTSTKPPYLIRTSELPSSALDHRVHPVDSTNHRFSLSLGDSTGLTKTGVHFCRLPPHATSTTTHYHTHDDEWYYIIDAGDDAALLVWEPGEGQEGQLHTPEGGTVTGTPRKEKIKAGDFLGFKAGAQYARAHAIRAGSKEVVYLVGGSRERMDASVYPLLGKRLIIDRSEGSLQTWAIEDKDMKVVHMKPNAVASGGSTSKG
ncbi:hypothetical protein BD414DRAFT_426325 [Trametes punicea]|nr:hypothetical protein BD414DRAFT_426325 [Trametes punicea]